MSTSKIILVISFLAVICIHADRITRVEVRTAECDDCGMSNTFGALRMQVCNSLVECCNTGKLDNSFHDDFREGAIDYFEGESILHECSIFDMKNSPADSILIVLNHEGTDGYQGDYVKVYVDSGYYQCYFSKFLDNEDSEQGQNCVYYQMYE